MGWLGEASLPGSPTLIDGVAAVIAAACATGG